MIRVGSKKKVNGKWVMPSYPGFQTIEVMMKSHSKWWPLSPYYLKDSKKRIMENIWQFSKIYENLPESKQKNHYTDFNYIWEWKADCHIRDGKITNNYWKWRNKGMNAEKAIRYPVGFNYKHTVVGALIEKDNYEGTLKYPWSNVEVTKLYKYIDSRKKVYLPLYSKLVKKEPLFEVLKNKLLNGDNLLIVEIDGPKSKSIDYYKNKYHVNDHFIQEDTIIVNDSNMEIMLNDPKHPFGHGYCLAMSLKEFII